MESWFFPKLRTDVVQGFMFKFFANVYAKKARKAGYKAEISYTPNWYLCGAKYWVHIEKEVADV